MKKRTKASALFLALAMLFSCCVTVFAEDEPPAAELPPLESLDTSAVNGRLIAYRGVETYFVVYPEPEEAEGRFDVRNAEITCSKEGIVTAEPDKVEEYRFGSVKIMGLKYGSVTVTVTEPESGISCSVKVIVVPAIGYYLRNFGNFLNYLPYFLFMRIAALFGNSVGA